MNLFLILILIFFIIAIILRVDFVFYILYVCAGLFLWSWFIVPRLLKKLKIQRRLPERVFWNESFAAEIEIQNPSWLPLPWLELRESIALELRYKGELDEAFTMPGRETVQFRYDLLAKRRGFYRVGPLHLNSGDLFGLTETQALILPPAFVTVYPRIHLLTELGLPSQMPFGTLRTRQRLFEDPSRPMGVRHFRSGDSLRQINWKVSARQRNLMAKTFQPAQSLDAAVVLNLTLDTYSRRERSYYIEWGIEVAASLATHLSDQAQAVGLLTNGYDGLQDADLSGDDDALFDETGRLKRPSQESMRPAPPIPPRTGRAHLMKILERLARLEPMSGTPFAPWLTTACQRLSWGSSLLIVTPNAANELTNALHQLSRNGLNPILILIEPLSESSLGEIRERGRRLGFVVYHVSSMHQMTQWQSG